MNQVQRLTEQIRNRNYVVGVIGLGYVGLPLILRFGEVGFRVIGFDIDTNKIEQLNEGKSYFKNILSNRVAALQKTGLLEATSDFSRIREADAVIICVPTPLNRHREPDLQYIEKTVESIAAALRPGQLISLESTTYPGTTEEVLLSKFSESNMSVGEDFFITFSPEREDPGNPHFTTSTIPKVVGGVTPNCLELGAFLYGQIIDNVVSVSSTRIAEAAKLLENIYRSVNVALVNELKITFNKMGVDIWEVIEAAKSKPFGFQPFYPGPGLGGHCIPIDPFYLTWKAREYGMSTRFIELAGEINNRMPDYVVEKLAEALNEHYKALRGAKVLVLGVSYKKDVDDLRESPSLEIMQLLLAKGVLVDYSDPYFDAIPSTRRHAFELRSVSITFDSIKDYDAVLVCTDHSDFPYELIFDCAELIVDTRNVFRKKGFTGSHLYEA